MNAKFSTIPSLASLWCISLAGFSNAAVTYSGVVNIPIPTNFNGIYLDLANQTSANPPTDPDDILEDRYTIGYNEPASWDLNFFFGGIGIAYSDTFSPFIDEPMSQGARILNVAIGTDIEMEAASRTLGINNFGGSGRPEGGVGQSHFDNPNLNFGSYSAFVPNTPGYIAFRVATFSGEQFGWMRVTLTNDGTPGTIHEWAYSNDTGFAVGVIPEPSGVLISMLASSLLFRRRRHRMADTRD